MNQLFQGDCLEIMPTLPDGCVDMVFADLPYETTMSEWDCLIPLDQLWEQYHRVVKENGAIILTAQAPFDKVLAYSNLKYFRYEWIWEKNKANGHLNAKKMPMKAHENVLVFYRKLPTYNPQMTHGHKPMNSVLPKDLLPPPDRKGNLNQVDKRLGNPGGSTTRYPRDVLQFPVINNDDPLKFHPTQKPVPLIEYFIKTYSNEGDTILDNCMGSGSTIIACKNINRQYIGIENNPEYFEKAREWVGSYDKIDPFVTDEKVAYSSLNPLLSALK